MESNSPKNFFSFVLCMNMEAMTSSETLVLIATSVYDQDLSVTSNLIKANR